MIETILFIILAVIGILSLVVALINLFTGIKKNSDALKKSALLIRIVPVICFGLIAYWYIVAIPSINQSRMEDVAGKYKIDTSLVDFIPPKEIDISDTELILNSDGTYSYHGIDCFNLVENGNWKTGGMDQIFELKSKNNDQKIKAIYYESIPDTTISFDLNQNNCESKCGRILFQKIVSN